MLEFPIFKDTDSEVFKICGGGELVPDENKVNLQFAGSWLSCIFLLLVD